MGASKYSTICVSSNGQNALAVGCAMWEQGRSQENPKHGAAGSPEGRGWEQLSASLGRV